LNKASDHLPTGKKLKHFSLYRSLCAWCPSNRCHPQLPNQQLREASGVAQKGKEAKPNNTTGEIIVSKYFNRNFKET
jgi:hypothetical protein